MAYLGNSHSFTNIDTPQSADSKNTRSSLNSAYRTANHTNQTWGTNNIWGNGSLSSGFASRAATRDTSTSRDPPFQHGRNDVEVVEENTGSASLVNSSVSDDWSYRTSWGSKRSLPSARSASHTSYATAAAAQPRSSSNAGPPQSFSSSQHQPSSQSRLPTIDLSATSAVPPRSNYASTFSNSFSAAASEHPPNVYTKFDRPSDPNVRRLPDFAKGGLWSDYSPSEERNSPFVLPPSSRGSLTNSRNGSQPPSRHGDDRTFFSRSDYSRNSLQPSQNNSRTPSISSPANGAFVNPFLSTNPDQLTHQFNQLSMNGDSRPPSSYKPSIPPNARFDPAWNLPTTFNFSRSSNGMAFDGGPLDDADDNLAPGFNSFNMNNHIAHDYTHDFRNYPNSHFGDKFFQPTTSRNGSNEQALSITNGSSMGHDGFARSRPNSSWQALESNSIPSNRSSRIPEDQPTYLDPRMQQLLDASLRNQYTYNPYALTSPVPLPGPPPFIPIMPMNLPGLGATAGSPEILNGDNVSSAIMYEFKSNTKSKRYELKDIYNHIAEFSGDQHGSRFIQTKLETANSDEKERVFREIEPNALPLMTDVFGNYVIQKFFEHGDQTHKRILASKMKGQVLHLSLQMYGCRVVQKALDHVLVDQQAQLISELESNVLKCVKDQNGNHVIQKAIERCPPNNIGFIIAAFRGQVQHLSIHPYGCRVIQRCLERCEPQSKGMIMLELMDGIQSMISDQYGNYVVQHVVEHDAGEARRRVLDIVKNGLEAYSKHKFASNVVEKCLEKADHGWRREVVDALANGDQRRCEGEAVLVGLIKDNFGNYVIQKLLDTLSSVEYGRFLDLLQPAITQAKRTGCGKQVLSIEKKMHRFPSFRGNNSGNAMGDIGSFNAAVYGLPLPPPPAPPFANYHDSSAATTPPPLTADTQSLQSSGIPSINGDAVEGAAASTFGGSRKGSDDPQQLHHLR